MVGGRGPPGATGGARSGGPGHQAIQEKLLNGLGAPGDDTEVQFGTRVADAFWPNGPKGKGPPIVHQIDGLNPGRGDPIARERWAIMDIVETLKKTPGMENAEIWFWNKKTPDAVDAARIIIVKDFPPSWWKIPSKVDPD